VAANLFFPEPVNAVIYASPQYRTRGPNPSSVGQDVELRGDASRFQALMMNVTPEAGGRYVGAYTFGISA